MNQKERIKYYDLLKFLAILTIIILHACWESDVLFHGHKLSFYTQISHFGVPLFLMISGVLLLNRDIEIMSFLKKKTARLVYPLAFYVIFTTFVFSIYPNVISGFWYAFMMVGIYLAIPIVNIFIKNAQMREIEYFLVIFILVSLFYEILLEYNIGTTLDLNFFMGPFSYLILGYYLSRKDLRKSLGLSSNVIILLGILIFIVSSLLKMYLGNYYGVYPNVEFISSKLDMSFIQVAQASAVFIICRYIYQDVRGIFKLCKRVLENNYVNHFIMSISRASYGMYLFHWFIVKLLRMYNVLPFKINTKQILVADLALALVLFIGSWLVILLLNRIPILNRVSGYA